MEEALKAGDAERGAAWGSRALCGLMADVRGLEEAALTLRDLGRWLEQIAAPPELIACVERFSAQLDPLRYSGAAGAAQSLAGEAAQVVQALGAHLRRQGLLA